MKFSEVFRYIDIVKNLGFESLKVDTLTFERRLSKHTLILKVCCTPGYPRTVKAFVYTFNEGMCVYYEGNMIWNTKVSLLESTTSIEDILTNIYGDLSAHIKHMISLEDDKLTLSERKIQAYRDLLASIEQQKED